MINDGFPLFYKNKIVIAGLVTAVALLFFCQQASAASGWLAKNEVQFKKSNLVIKTMTGHEHNFVVEVALTEEQHDRGLMFRREVPSGTGMLFVFNPSRPVAMWMKNTYVPLDMLFVREDGAIIKIIEKTVPMDLTALNSDSPVAGVIEMKGGEAVRLGINIGDLVMYERFMPPKMGGKAAIN